MKRTATKCVNCPNGTTVAFADAHEGLCKSCHLSTLPRIVTRRVNRSKQEEVNELSLFEAFAHALARHGRWSISAATVANVVHAFCVELRERNGDTAVTKFLEIYEQQQQYFRK